MTNRVCEILGIEKPVIQAAMAYLTTPEMVAAVSNAGGLGTLGLSGESADQLRDKLIKIKSLTDKPFALNLSPFKDPQEDTVTHASSSNASDAGEEDTTPISAATAEEIFQLAVAENVPVVLWSGLMNRKWAKKFKEAGIKIIFRAGTPTAENTREAIEAGVDVIIATGFDEGGTVPAKVIGTFAILPLIVDAADGKVPVVAAGGLVDKRTVRAAFDLGAEGVYAGTAFLATEESPLAENIKQDMLKYDADDLLMFRAPNSFYRSLPGELPEKLLEMDKQGKSAAEIWAAAGDYNCLLYGMHDGDLSRGIASFGLGISSIHSIDPVSVVVDRLNSGVIA